MTANSHHLGDHFGFAFPLNAVDAVRPTVAGNYVVTIWHNRNIVRLMLFRLGQMVSLFLHRFPKHRQAFWIVFDDRFDCTNIFAFIASRPEPNRLAPAHKTQLQRTTSASLCLTTAVIRTH
jgi:hypothetical protein